MRRKVEARRSFMGGTGRSASVPERSSRSKPPSGLKLARRYRFSARPRVSNPEPRFEVEQGTRTLQAERVGMEQSAFEEHAA
jgi:hypothetical protein